VPDLRLLIVEDEPLIRVGIRNAVAGLPGVVVVGECECVADAVVAITSDTVDLVLLDVQLPDGTGFDVVRQVGAERMPTVIFVTAYDQYAVRAFDVHAVDYLLKPFDTRRLCDSIERVRTRLARPADIVQQLQGLLDVQSQPWLQRLVVRNGEHFDFVPVDAIDWIESANNDTILHCRGRDFTFNQNLAALERQLDPRRFVRVHRGHIVNVERVLGANTLLGGAYELQLRSGVTVRTGRQYADTVRHLLKSR